MREGGQFNLLYFFLKIGDGRGLLIGLGPEGLDLGGFPDAIGFVGDYEPEQLV